jgi:hypothetical protein
MNMKVQELIAELSKFSPDAEVRYYFPLHNHMHQVAAMQVSSVELRLAHPQKGASDILVPQMDEGDYLRLAREVVTIL